MEEPTVLARHIMDAHATSRQYKHWKEAEHRFVMDNYARHGPQFCADHLGRTKNAIRCRANIYGLKYRPRYKPWIREEDAPLRHAYWLHDEDTFLINNYAEHGATYCAHHLGRTILSVQCRARMLGLKYRTRRANSWEGAHNTFLLTHYLQHGPQYCADHLGRTWGAVTKQASRLGIRRKHRKGEE